jgi:hypothetical protein
VDAGGAGRVVTAVAAAVEAVTGHGPVIVTFHEWGLVTMQLHYRLVTAATARAVFAALGADPGVLSKPYGDVARPQAALRGIVPALGIELWITVTDPGDIAFAAAIWGQDPESTRDGAGTDPDTTGLAADTDRVASPGGGAV